MTWSESAQRMVVVGISMAGVAPMAISIGVIAVEASRGRAAFADALSIDAMRNSVVWSAAGASLVLIVGTLLGYWRAKATRRMADAADGLWVTLFAVPATVLGVGIIGLWNRPGILGDIYRTDAIVVLAYLGRFLPVGALLCAAFLHRVTLGSEEAAIVSGATWRRTFTRIVLPMAGRALAAVWLMMFILIFGDVALTILLAPPGESNLPVRAYTLIANSPTSDVARLALVQIAISILPLGAIAWLLRRRQEHAS